MLMTILSHTPLWVWGLLLVLAAVGFSQTRARTASLPRVIVLPLAMTAFSLYGTFSALNMTALNGVMWLGAAAVTGVWCGTGAVPPGVHFDAASRSFRMPGSWVPLVLMMGVFATKYLVAVWLAMVPLQAHDPAVATLVTSLYGAISGIFVGRLARLLRAMRAPSTAPDASSPMVWG